MPRQFEWLHRVPEMLQIVEETVIPLYDRHHIGMLFNLQRSAALETMKALGAWKVGKNLVLPRRELLLALNRILQTGKCEQEQRRRETLEAKLEAERQKLKGRKHVLYMTDSLPAGNAERLPSSVQLEPGRLTVTFFGAEDLGRQLHEISLAMVDDWEWFRRRVGD